MEFLIVPLIFGIALVLLGIGKIFNGKELGTSCSSSKNLAHHGYDDVSCGACDNEDVKSYLDKNDPGLDKVAKLGYPNRKKRFIDKLDFRPERFN